jgi:hypothetical protein
MTAADAISLVLGLAALVYLVWALLEGERL